MLGISSSQTGWFRSTFAHRRRKKNSKDKWAGSPFEIPYNLHLPSREPNKWRTHRDQILNSRLIIDQLLTYADVGHTIYLKALKSSDDKALAFINAIINP